MKWDRVIEGGERFNYLTLPKTNSSVHCNRDTLGSANKKIYIFFFNLVLWKTGLLNTLHTWFIPKDGGLNILSTYEGQNLDLSPYIAGRETTDK